MLDWTFAGTAEDLWGLGILCLGLRWSLAGLGHRAVFSLVFEVEAFWV